MIEIVGKRCFILQITNVKYCPFVKNNSEDSEYTNEIETSGFYYSYNYDSKNGRFTHASPPSQNGICRICKEMKNKEFELLEEQIMDIMDENSEGKIFFNAFRKGGEKYRYVLE